MRFRSGPDRDVPVDEAAEDDVLSMLHDDLVAARAEGRTEYPPPWPSM